MTYWNDRIHEKVNVVSQMLKYVGWTKPTLLMYVLHNLHGQLSLHHDVIFCLNIDRDGTSLISVGTKFHNWGARWGIVSRPIFTESFSVFANFWKWLYFTLHIVKQNLLFCLYIWVFFHEYLQFTGKQG